MGELDSGLPEEPYYAMSWLIAEIVERGIDVACDDLLDAFALLEPEDQETYRPDLDTWLGSHT